MMQYLPLEYASMDVICLIRDTMTPPPTESHRHYGSIDEYNTIPTTVHELGCKLVVRVFEVYSTWNF